MNGFDKIYQEYKNHPKFNKAFEKLETTIIKYINNPQYNDPHYGTNAKWGGYYDSNNNLIAVFVYNLIPIGQNLNINYIFQKTKITQVLIHELRHLFQYNIYPEYFTSNKAYKHPYDTRHIELDASWSDIVGKINKDTIFNNINHINDLTNEIIQDLKNIKKLSPKLENHYKIKTIKYFTNIITQTIDNKFSEILTQKINLIQTIPPQEEYIDQEIKELTTETISELENYIKYNIGKKLNTKQIQEYKRKARRTIIKHIEPIKINKKIKNYINDIYPQWNNIIENYLDNNDIQNINLYKAATIIINELMNKNKKLFYSSNKISDKLRKHFFQKSVDLLKFVKDKK